MARKTADPKPVDAPVTIARALTDVISKNKDVISFNVGTDPAVLIPTESIGLEVVMQCPGIPVNRISMSTADAHGGKTTFSHVLANIFSRNDGDVILIEGDESLDENYVARFYDYNPTTEDERVWKPLQYLIDSIDKRIEGENLEKGHIIAQKQKMMLLRRKAVAESILENKTIDETNDLEKTILEVAQNIYRIKHVLRIGNIRTMEELEALITQIHKSKLTSDPKMTRNTLIIVDPISRFLPKEMLDQEDSSSGRKMSMATYLNQFFRRWGGPLSRSMIHLHLTAPKSTFIAIDPYARYSDLDKLPTMGGKAQQLACSFIFFFEAGREVKEGLPDQNALVEKNLPPFREGFLKVPKKKLQGGYSMPKDYRCRYWLFTQGVTNKMDFDLPFMEMVYKCDLFNITYKGGFAYIPPEYLQKSKNLEIQKWVEVNSPIEEKPKDEPGYLVYKLRRSEATTLLLKSEVWRQHIHRTMGIATHLI